MILECPEKLILCYIYMRECWKGWCVRPYYWYFSAWNQFISTVNIRSKFRFEPIPVTLFQKLVLDNTEGLRLVQGRGSTQNLPYGSTSSVTSN